MHVCDGECATCAIVQRDFFFFCGGWVALQRGELRLSAFNEGMRSIGTRGRLVGVLSDEFNGYRMTN